MKIIVILILFCASLYGADITTTNVVGDITTKIAEHTDSDGKPEVRIETLYRGETRILQTLSRTNKQGTLTIWTRTYFVGGEPVVTESDEDGHGGLDHVTVYSPGTPNLEMFTRQPDGSLKPVSTEKMKALQRQTATTGKILSESFDKMTKKDMTDQEISVLLQETKQKVENASKDQK